MLASSLSEHASNETQDLIISNRVLNGERELFALLLKPHNRSVYFAVKTIATEDSLTEKIMLASYATALKRLYCFFGQYPFRVWLLSIAISEARRLHTTNTGNGHGPRSREGSEETLLVFSLARFGRLSVKEISTCLQIPVREVKRHLQIARHPVNEHGNTSNLWKIARHDHDVLVDRFMGLLKFNPTEIYSDHNINETYTGMRIDDSDANAIHLLRKKHSENLQLCSNIRVGFLKGVEMHRIKSYADWYWNNHLRSHFTSEERVIFPILGSANPLVKKAVSEHRRLRRLFESKQEIHKMLNRIEEELSAHIRFEERVLFREIEQHAGKDGMELMEDLHHGDREEQEWPDQFWK